MFKKLFGFKKTNKDKIKEMKKGINSEIREIDKKIQKIKRDENKAKLLLKKVAKINDKNFY